MKKYIFITEDDLYEDRSGLFLLKGDVLMQTDIAQIILSEHQLRFIRLRDNKVFYIMESWLEDPKHFSYIKHIDITDRQNLVPFI